MATLDAQIAETAQALDALRAQQAALAQALQREWILPLADALVQCVIEERWPDAKAAAHAYVVARWRASR